MATLATLAQLDSSIQSQQLANGPQPSGHSSQSAAQPHSLQHRAQESLPRLYGADRNFSCQKTTKGWQTWWDMILIWWGSTGLWKPHWLVTVTSRHRKTHKPSQIRQEQGKHHSQHLAAVSVCKQTEILVYTNKHSLTRTWAFCHKHPKALRNLRLCQVPSHCTDP